MMTCLITPLAGLSGIREADRRGMKSLELLRPHPADTGPPFRRRVRREADSGSSIPNIQLRQTATATHR